MDAGTPFVSKCAMHSDISIAFSQLPNTDQLRYFAPKVIPLDNDIAIFLLMSLKLGAVLCNSSVVSQRPLLNKEK